MNLLVVGNGYLRKTDHHSFYVNKYTSEFILQLRESYNNVIFAQPVNIEEEEKGLNNALIDISKIDILELSKYSIIMLFRLIRAVINSEYIYIFFPGSWPRIVSGLALLLNKKYGLYIRGEEFSEKGYDAKIIRGSRFVSTVTGIDARAEKLGAKVYPIAPMLGVCEQDIYIRNFEDLSNRSLRILFVGRVEKEKGVLELIDAARRLEQIGLQFELHIVGGGELTLDIKKRILAESINSVVIKGLINEKDNLMREYEWADIFIMPSHHEGFPRVLYEAMIKSCTILTTFVGGISTVMKDGVNCIKIPISDSKAIADKVIMISRNNLFMRRLTDNARKDALDLLKSRKKHIDVVRENLNQIR